MKFDVPDDKVVRERRKVRSFEAIDIRSKSGLRMFQRAFVGDVYMIDYGGRTTESRSCSPFSPDLFPPSLQPRSALIFAVGLYRRHVRSASSVLVVRACTRWCRGYKVTGEANRTSDKSQLVEISYVRILHGGC